MILCFNCANTAEIPQFVSCSSSWSDWLSPCPNRLYHCHYLHRVPCSWLCFLPLSCKPGLCRSINVFDCVGPWLFDCLFLEPLSNLWAHSPESSQHHWYHWCIFCFKSLLPPLSAPGMIWLLHVPCTWSCYLLSIGIGTSTVTALFSLLWTTILSVWI